MPCSFKIVREETLLNAIVKRPGIFLMMILFASLFFSGHGQAQTANEKSADEQMATVDDVLATGEPGTIALTQAKQGNETYTASSDCEVVISSCLQTYGPAQLSVTVNEEKVISWKRENDRDPAKLIVRGEEIAGSNEDVGGGDYTPTTQKTTLKLKKGDKVTLNLSGDFGQADAHLSITGPGIERKDKVPGTGDSIDASPGETIMGSGGGFLWKPISDSRGGVAVILLPSKYRHEMFNRKIWINGLANEVLEWRNDYANGNRMHIFLKKRGAQYGGKVKIVLGLAGGGKIQWNVADGSKRTEK
jgi:hypothetical protein